MNIPSPNYLIVYSNYGLIKVSGQDASKFLQGQLTCDINLLKPQQPHLGAYCNVKGRVECIFTIWPADSNNDNYFLRLPKTMVSQTIAELSKYAVFSKVNISDCSEDYGQIIQITPASALVVTTNNPLPLPYGNDCYLIIDKLPKIKTIWQNLTKTHKVATQDFWESLEIEAEIPEIYPETAGKFLAHDLNLPQLNAVSFTKGCFRGQEIIARMQHLGKIKKHLHKINIDNTTDNTFGNIIRTADNTALAVISRK